jgi:hypothetical protein
LVFTQLVMASVKPIEKSKVVSQRLLIYIHGFYGIASLFAIDIKLSSSVGYGSVLHQIRYQQGFNYRENSILIKLAKVGIRRNAYLFIVVQRELNHGDREARGCTENFCHEDAKAERNTKK